MKAVQVLAAVLVMACARADEENPYYKPLRACGAHLAQTLHEVCLYEAASNPVSEPLTLAEECCEKECDVRVMRKFCRRMGIGYNNNN